MTRQVARTSLCIFWVFLGLLLAANATILPQNATIVPVDLSQNITWPYQKFKTVDFKPPVLNVTQHITSSSEGYLFFAPDGATEVQLAPLIMDVSGELIWNGPLEHAFNFGAYEYKGERVLAWWNGTLFPEPIGRGNGVIYIYNDKYEELFKVTLPGDFLELTPGDTFPSNIDLHELFITPNGSIVVTANNVTQADLTSVGGPSDGWVVTGLVYEIDIATNEVLFSWNSLDHLDQLPFSDSLYPLGSEGYTGKNQSLAWGYFHINAVEPYDGGYMISSRYFCSAIHIDAKGEVLWRLSGRPSANGGNFTLDGNDMVTGFCYQHDVRVVNGDSAGVTLSMHDNHNSPIENGTVPSTGKVIHVDFGSKKASLEQRLLNHSGPIYSTAQGNYQALDDKNLFVGHGWIPVMEEYSAAGDILTTIQFGTAEPRPGGGFLSPLAPTLSYRSFKQHWTGCPNSTPAVVGQSSAKGTTVYVSWNGATDVVSWEIYGGNSKAKQVHLATVSKAGFETKADVKKVKYVSVTPKLKPGSSCKVETSSVVAVT